MQIKQGKPISEVAIKQIALIGIIIILAGLICYNLSMFIPSLLGAITLYIISRKYLLYLIEEKKWKPSLAAIVIIVATLLILILPVYLIIDVLIDKLGNAQAYMQKFNVFIDKIHDFVFKEVGIDLLSKENINKLKDTAGRLSTSLLNTTFNALTVIASMYFVLYFMLISPRKFERLLESAAPFKKSNNFLLGEKIRKMVIANAIGIPVVALGQGIAGLIGYIIFGAPSPVLLFALTFVTSMIPIVGAAIVYVPICIFMIAEGQTGAGIGLAIYCLVVVGLIDNLLRFTLLKKLEDIHPLNTVFGIIAGMNIFGFLGLIFGPILVSVTILLMQVYKDEFLGRKNSPPDDELLLEKDE
ncbi:AI-2E family transporter [Elizabethkingia miricola]|uniref:AI-2E family transporter n=1 Tax=Elizabethkingia miricola TaxID=172045 RepID=UPI000999A6AF|nr:AI-2E family transporter [Elizabethkingia miricola]OPC08181.1 AI-2E family transporter [Elizabethkingia miricola]